MTQQSHIRYQDPSTPTSNDSPDINKELNTYRVALELNNFKKQLETLSIKLV